MKKGGEEEDCEEGEGCALWWWGGRVKELTYGASDTAAAGAA